MNAHRFVRWSVLLGALACQVLNGCALLTKHGANDAVKAPPPAIRLEIQAPGELKELLGTHLDLGRLPVVAAGAHVSEAELTRLVAATPEQARSLLATEGYFKPDIRVERLGGTPPRVRVSVETGPQATINDLRIDIQGAEATRRGDRGAMELQQALRAQWPLPPGAAFRNAVWSEAKNSALAQLRARGYIKAKWLDTTARVDGTLQKVDLALTVDTGPLARVGELRVRGLEHHDEQTVRNLANFSPGVPATQELLLDYQERLQASGLFDRATVLLDTDAADLGSVPVTVQVSERRLQEATLGLGVSSDVGLRGTLDHVHRRAFGYAATARNQFELAGARQSWEGELSTHPLPGLYRNLVSGAATRVESESDIVSSVRVRLGRARNTQRTDSLRFAEVERSLRRTDTFREQSEAIAVHYHGIWRRVDDILLPTRGYVLGLQTGGGHARSKPGLDGPFVRLYGRLAGYRPLGPSWYGQARLELGQVIARSGVTVPEAMRFRAGGNESVRGYTYRSLAPTVDGDLTSGKVLFTTSAEIARPLIQRLPRLWGAAFIDAGRAADRWSELEPAIGIGIGLRYRSPIGPLSLDLAWGEEVEKLRLHLSVGVTF